MNLSKNYQILTLSGKEYAVVPRDDYETLYRAVDEDEIVRADF